LSREGVFLGGGKFAEVLAQFGRDVHQAKLLENLPFRLALDQQGGVARFDVGFEQAVFVEPQAALDGALAHDDVMLLAAGEIGEGEGKFRVAYHAQIRLDAALQHDTGLGIALGADADDARLRGEKLDDGGRVARRGEKINVANDLLAAAQTAGGAAARDVRMLAQAGEDRFGGKQGVAVEMARGVLAAEIYSGEDVGLRFFTKAGQFRDFSLLTGGFQLFGAFEAELVVEGFDLFGSKAGDGEHEEQARRDRIFQFLVVGEFAGGEKLANFFVDAFANALDVGLRLRREDGFQRLAQGFDGAGGVLVGARLEWVLAFEFEQGGDLRQYLCDLFLIHGLKISWKWSGEKLDYGGTQEWNRRKSNQWP